MTCIGPITDENFVQPQDCALLPPGPPLLCVSHYSTSDLFQDFLQYKPARANPIDRVAVSRGFRNKLVGFVSKNISELDMTSIRHRPMSCKVFLGLT